MDPTVPMDRHYVRSIIRLLFSLKELIFSYLDKHSPHFRRGRERKPAFDAKKTERKIGLQWSNEREQVANENRREGTEKEKREEGGGKKEGERIGCRLIGRVKASELAAARTSERQVPVNEPRKGWEKERIRR